MYHNNYFGRYVSCRMSIRAINHFLNWASEGFRQKKIQNAISKYEFCQYTVLKISSIDTKVETVGHFSLYQFYIYSMLCSTVLLCLFSAL